MKVRFVLLPVAVLAVGWVGYRVLARRPTVPGDVAVKAEGAPKRVRRAPPARRPERDPEAAAIARIAAATPAARDPSGAPVPPEVETPPPVVDRPPNVVHGTPDELAVHRQLTPMVERRENAGLRFVTCEPAPAPAPGAEPGPLEAPARDPAQPICLARIQTREAGTLRDILREASATYRGHLVAEVRERMEAFGGRWFEADVRVDTDEPYPVPEL